MDKTPEEQLAILRADLETLRQEVFRNNFSSHQDFNKTSNFTTRLLIPNPGSLPPVCDINEIAGVDGIMYICQSTNTWVKVSLQ